MKYGRTVIWILVFLVAAITAVFIAIAPDAVPVHYNFAGEIDRMGSKYELLVFPGLATLFGVFWAWASQKLTKEPTEQKVLVIVGILFELLMGGMSTFFMYKALNYDQINTGISVAGDVLRFVSIVLGLLLAVLGLILPHVKRNSFIGIRTAWSLSGDEVWHRSQLFSGISAVICGVLVLAAAFVTEGTACFIVCMVSAILWAALSIIMSYVYYRREAGNEPK